MCNVTQCRNYDPERLKRYGFACDIGISDPYTCCVFHYAHGQHQNVREDKIAFCKRELGIGSEEPGGAK